MLSLWSFLPLEPGETYPLHYTLSIFCRTTCFIIDDIFDAIDHATSLFYPSIDIFYSFPKLFRVLSYLCGGVLHCLRCGAECILRSLLTLLKSAAQRFTSDEENGCQCNCKNEVRHGSVNGVCMERIPRDRGSLRRTKELSE